MKYIVTETEIIMVKQKLNYASYISTRYILLNKNQSSLSLLFILMSSLPCFRGHYFLFTPPVSIDAPRPTSSPPRPLLLPFPRPPAAIHSPIHSGIHPSAHSTPSPPPPPQQPQMIALNV